MRGYTQPPGHLGTESLILNLTWYGVIFCQFLEGPDLEQEASGKEKKKKKGKTFFS